jgi:hypothetical protein
VRSAGICPHVMTKYVAVALLVVLGCTGAHRELDQLAPDGGVRGDVGGDPDAPDAPPTCGELTCSAIPAPSCVDRDTLRTYAATCADDQCSYPPTEVECGAAGCCDDHCCELAPSNADVFGSPTPTGLIVAPPSGVFNTNTGCVAVSTLGTCSVVTRPGLSEACVCRSDELTIGSLAVTGDRALVILAYRTVSIVGTLDISGYHRTDGPGASRVFAAGTAGQEGGAGGSYGSAGGASSGFSSPGTFAAAVYGDAALIPLLGGMRGQPGGDPNGGGGGGGALQITAGERITVTGMIYAAGGGGDGGSYASRTTSGGGGGGSGGAVLLEAPAIKMTGTVAANGGGGGGGGRPSGHGWNGAAGAHWTSGRGADGGYGATESCTWAGSYFRGDGGEGSMQSNPGGRGERAANSTVCSTTVFNGGGGGGGGGGRIRINTITGCECSGRFSPAPSLGLLQLH